VREGQFALADVAVEEATPDRRATPARVGADPIGLVVEALTRARRDRLGGDAGVLVRRADGAAQRAGLEPGDIILSLNAAPVATPYALYELLRSAGPGTSVALLVQRDGARSFVALRLPD
jgi:serine protease Do